VTRVKIRLLLVAAIVGLAVPTWAGQGVVAQEGAERPTRVLIIVLDQMRPDYVERFDMENVASFMEGGVNFPRAILGHMAAETVISHNVMTSGMFPKHMGWSNEVLRDADDVFGSAEGEYVVTSSMGCSQFGQLVEHEGYPKLGDYLDQIDPGGDARFVAIGQKTTASCNAGQPADANDIVVRAGSAATLDCDEDGTSERWRPPAGVNVPPYIATFCGRFYVNVTPTYGTATTAPAWMYPLDGDRFAIGTSTDRIGGDIWTADAAIDVMRNEPDWDGMLVSLPSIDKMGHMWGTGADDPGPSGVGDDVYDFAHLPKVAEIADGQVGRLMQELDAQGVLDETLVVLTADHAGQTAHRFHGVNAFDRGNFNWYYGQDADETYLSPSPDLAPLVPGNPNVDFSYQDGHIAVFLDDTSTTAKQDAALDVRELPDVIAAYYRSGDRYVRHGSLGPMSPKERSWWRQHGQRLLDTMAADYGPDVVGLMRDDTSYGVMGDHGGHQRAIQEIPIVFSWPGLEAGARLGRQMRSVDILPTILRLIGIDPDPDHPMDGRAIDLPRAD
jgi:hypothetical protein